MCVTISQTVEPVVKRVTVTIEDDVYDYLEKRAADETRTVPNLLAHLAAMAMKESQESQDQQTRDNQTKP
ncbi:hypothetical protein N836_34315 [Leptolyngbya sp. Heron Island J]|uniref:ribbon-helix-helix domain-containing protein n=1 Tax=Leptolyngbya sp. Heron Island J TaxID=1385935 RepID=UPI0003B94AFD|nr:hypothetical protein [Leptolyngbya sp. Heron Island J]ESA37981.1 hypothetical protein N836_34315 [Leptolyngbya sp. Heron Island J]